MIAKADLKAMLHDYDEDQSERGEGTSFYRPPIGRSYVRLLPPHEDAEGRAIIRGGTHWVGQTVLCPTAFRAGSSCFFCDRVEELLAAGNEADAKEAASLRRRATFYANVIDPSDLDKGIMVWEFGRSIYDQILKYMGDPDYGDISDPNEGYDLAVERQGAGMKTRYHLRARKSASALGADILDMLEEPGALMDLSNVRKFLTPEEMMELYEGALEGEEEEEPHQRQASRTTIREDDEDDREPEALDDEEAKPARGARPGWPIRPAARNRSTREAVESALQGHSVHGS